MCLSKCLNNGSYRLMVRIMDLRGPGDYDTYTLMVRIMDLRGPGDYDTYTLGVEFVIGR